MEGLLAAECREVSNTSKDILVNALKEKRADLMGALERNEAERVKIIADLGTVDSALFMFAPEIRVDKIAAKHLPPAHLSGRGEMTRILFNILRDAREPISTMVLNRMIMEARNLNTADVALVEKMRGRTHSCLRNHRAHGRIRSVKSADGRESLWEVAR